MESAALVPIGDIERMGTAIAKSGLFGLKTPDQAIALMLIANAEGLHPAIAARDYDVIQGRPALKAKAKLARFQRSGGKVHWVKSSDTECVAEFSHPSSPEPLRVEWDMRRASVAGLGGKDNWKKYPRQMLRARVISEGVDAVYPDAGGLMYVPEEVQDFDDKPVPEQTRQPVETEATVVDEAQPAPPVEQHTGSQTDSAPSTTGNGHGRMAAGESRVYKFPGGVEIAGFKTDGPCLVCGKGEGKQMWLSSIGGACYECCKAGKQQAQPVADSADPDLPF